MQLTKREYEYRQKSINEFHCNKLDQNALDKFIKYNNCFYTYYNIYKNKKEWLCKFSPIVHITYNETKATLSKLGISIEDENKNVRSLYDILSDISNRWHSLITEEQDKII